MSSLYFFIRPFLRKLYLSGLGTFTTPQPGVHILNGHRIEDELEPAAFEALLSALSKHVRFVNVEDAVDMIVQKVEPEEPTVAFTFDDGFIEDYTIFAPTLERLGVNAIFFVNPNYVDGDEAYIENFNKNIVKTKGRRPMRWKQIEELSHRGFVIGAHTMDHYMINSNDIEELSHQIVDCKRVISEHTGTECEYFAFPYGKLEHACLPAIDIACENYKYVFSQSDYKHYLSFDGRVINRRHFEPFWPVSHVRYFLSCKKQY